MSFGQNHQVLRVRDVIANAVRGLGLTNKQIARTVAVSERSVENWKAAIAMPSGEALTALYRESDQFWREFCAAVDRPADADAAAQFMDDFNEWRKARMLNVPE